MHSKKHLILYNNSSGGEAVYYTELGVPHNLTTPVDYKANIIPNAVNEDTHVRNTFPMPPRTSNWVKFPLKT